MDPENTPPRRRGRLTSDLHGQPLWLVFLVAGLFLLGVIGVVAKLAGAH
jgi:hypothetical protein